MKPFMTIVILLFVCGLAYTGYTYLKQDPPDVLVSLVAHQTQEPLLVEEGQRAPLNVADGFSAQVYVRGVEGVRVLTRDPKGTLIASQTSQGKIVALPDFDNNGVADEVRVIAEGLDAPHGIAFVCPDSGFASADQDTCVLYVAETGALKSYAYDADTFTVRNEKTLLSLPTEGGGHFTRTLLLHPDGTHLLISVGSSCNVCEEKDAQRASILAYDVVSGEVASYATGLRNTVFMAIDPITGSVWGTDNGRDAIGDDIPPDEVNILTQGHTYGWPYCFGNRVFDTDFNKNDEVYCNTTEMPHISLQAHSAALGLAFIPEEGWPEAMRNDLLIAYHGSWNRTEPTGYKVVRFDLEPTDERKALNASTDFLSGFLREGEEAKEAIGRPVAVLAEPGGVVFVSDDKAGAIYRVAHETQ